MTDQLQIELDGTSVVKGVNDVLKALTELKAMISSFATSDPTGRVRQEVAALSTAAVSVVDQMQKAVGGIGNAVEQSMRQAEAAARAGGKRTGEAAAKGLEEGLAGLRSKSASNIDARTLLGLEPDAVRKSATASAEIFKEAFRAQSALKIDPRTLLGLPSRDEMKSAGSEIVAQMREGVATERLRARSATRIDERTLLGLPSRDEMKTLGAQLAAQMREGVRTEGLRSKSASNIDARTLLGLEPDAVRKSAKASADVFKEAFASGALADPMRKKVDELGGAMRDAHGAARGLASGLNAIWLTWGAVGPLLAGAAVSHAFVQSIRQGAQFEQNLAAIGNLAGASAREVDLLTASAIQFARLGPVGPTEVSAALKTLALAGLDAKEQLAAIQSVMSFSIAGEIPLEKAAESLVSISTAFGYSATGFGAVSDVIAKAAAISMTSVSSMTESFKVASTVAQQFGVSVQDAATTLALLSQVGIKGTAAGTAMRNMYVELIGQSREAKKVLQDVLKVDVIDNATKAMKPLSQILKELSTSLSQYDFRTQIELLQKLGNERGMKALSADLTAFVTAAKGSGKDVITEFEKIRQALEDAPGFTAQAAAGMARTTLNQMRAVSSALQATLVEAFGKVNTEVQITSQALRQLFNSKEFQQGLDNLIGSVASAVGWLVEHKKELAAVALGYVLGKAALVGYSVALSAAASAQTLLAGTSLAASAGLRLVLTALGPLAAVAAMAGTAYLIFADNAVASSDRAAKAAAAHSATSIDAIDKELARLDKQIQARAEGATAAELAARTEAGLAMSRLVGLHDEERAALQTVHAVKLLNRERLAGTEYANTAQGARALATLDNELGQSRLRIADVVIRQLTEENRLREKQRELFNKAKQDAKEAEAEANLRRQIQTGNKTVPPKPDYSGTSAQYANELKEITNIIAASELKGRALDEQSKLDEFRLQQSYERGALSYATYQDQLSTIASRHLEERLQLELTTQRRVEQELTELRAKAAALDPKGEPAKKLANDIDTLSGKLVGIQAKVQGVANDGYKQQMKLQTDALKPSAELVRNQEQNFAALQNNVQQEIERLSIKENILAVSEREQFVQAEVARGTNAMVDALVKAEAVFKESLGKGVFDDLDNPDVRKAFENHIALIDRLKGSIASATTQLGDVASRAFDSRKINEIAKNLNEGLAEAIMNAGKEGGEGLWNVVQEELFRKPFKIALQAALQPFSQSIAGTIYGLTNGFSGNGTLQEDAAGNTWLSGASNLASIGALFGAGGLSGSLAAGAGWLTGASTLGGSLTAGASLLGTGTMAGAASGLGMIAGALGPLAIAAGALYAIAQNFKGETRSGGYYQYAPGTGTTFTRGPSGGQIAGDQVTEMITATAGTINSLLAGFGSAATLTAFQAGLESSEKGRGGVLAGGTLSTGALFGEDGSGSNYDGNFFEKFSAQTLDGQQALENFGVEMVQVIFQALKAAPDLPAALSKQLAGIDPETLGKDAGEKLLASIQAQIAAVKEFGAAMKLLPFAALRDLSFDAAAALGEAAGGLGNLAAGLASYFENYFSEEEKKLNLARLVQARLAEGGLNFTQEQILKGSRAQFKALTEHFYSMGEAGRTAWLALIDVNDEFAQMVPALDAVADPIAAILSDVEKAKDVLIDSLQDQIGEWEALVSRMKDAAKNLREFRDELLLGELSPLNPTQKYAEARSQFDSTYAAALAGDEDAIAGLQGAATAFLEASREYQASGGSYNSDFALVSAAIASVAGVADGMVTDTQKQIEAMRAQLTQLGVINTSVVGVSQAVAGYSTAIIAAINAGAGADTSGLNAVLRGLAGVTGQAVGTAAGSIYASAGGATMLNGLIFGSNGQSILATDAVLAINQMVSTGQAMRAYEAFKAYGVTLGDADRLMSWTPGTAAAWAAANNLPAFMNGGDHSGGWAMFGEGGPELVYTPPSRVYSAQTTNTLLGQNDAIGTKLDRVVAAIDQLREENNVGHRTNAMATAEGASEVGGSVSGAARQSRRSAKIENRAAIR